MRNKTETISESSSFTLLQWKYNAGNSWGVDPDSGEGCVGCGPQEQFYGCSDVAIGYSDTVVTGVPPQRFPWLFQEPGYEWHYGIAYVFGSRGIDSASISAASKDFTMRTLCVITTVSALLIAFGCSV